MKVLVLGLPRTGTQCASSTPASRNNTNELRHQALADALSQLGISNVYHMREVGKNKHQGLWVQALEDNLEGKGSTWGRDDFEKILTGFEVCIPNMWLLGGKPHYIDTNELDLRRRWPISPLRSFPSNW